MLNRVEPNLEPALVLSEIETSILDRLIPDPAHDPPAARTLPLYLTKIARLGGYLAQVGGRVGTNGQRDVVGKTILARRAH